jgi:Chaperone of endosialidase
VLDESEHPNRYEESAVHRNIERLFAIALTGLFVSALPSAAANAPPKSGASTSFAPARLVPPQAGHARRNASCQGLGSFAFVGGSGGSSTPNVAAGAYSGVLSGQGNQACANDSGVAVGTSNVASNVGSFIGGGSFNVVNGGQLGGSIVGGISNTVVGAYGVVGGGSGNNANGEYSAAIAGIGNTVNGQAAGVLAGWSNTAAGDFTTIGGGKGNATTADYSTIPGGYGNSANGKGAFAAGQGAHANNQGSFVWSDEHKTPVVKSTAADQFVARASGGVIFYSSIDESTGVTLPPGSGSWSSLSDRSVKTGIARLDDAAVLRRVAALPVTEWSYRAEGLGIRHLGPMAQDFHALFGVGEDARHIATIDEAGVALAAIKGLKAENDGLRTRLHETNRRLEGLQHELTRLQQSLAKLESAR